MNIDELIKVATLEKNSAAKEAYRAIKAELLLNSSSKTPKSEGKIVNKIYKHHFPYSDTHTEVTELDLSIIRKLIKEREEQISMYDANSRKDLADMYREQLKCYKDLLPPEISADRLEEAIVTVYPNGYTQKEMGRVVKEIKEFFPTADGKVIATLVKKHINQ